MLDLTRAAHEINERVVNKGLVMGAGFLSVSSMSCGWSSYSRPAKVNYSWQIRSLQRVRQGPNIIQVKLGSNSSLIGKNIPGQRKRKKKGTKKESRFKVAKLSKKVKVMAKTTTTTTTTTMMMR